VEWKNVEEIAFAAISITLVSATLIAFNYFEGRHK
jgi:hypothetical protein